MLHAGLRGAREYRPQVVEKREKRDPGTSYFDVHGMWHKKSGIKDAIGGEAHMRQVQRTVESVRSGAFPR